MKMPSQKLKRNLPKLKRVCKAGQKGSGLIKKKFLKDREFFDSVSELCLNTAIGNIPLSAAARRKCKLYKIPIALIASKPKSQKVREEVLPQVGGFLPYILPAALLAFELYNSIKKKTK